MISKEQKAQLKQILYASKYYDDMIYDLKYMLKDFKEKYAKKIDEYDKFWIDKNLTVLDAMEDAKTEYKNRMYVVVGVRHFQVACIDLPDFVIERIIADVETELRIAPRLSVNRLELNMISTIYIFKKKKLAYTAYVHPHIMGLIIQALRRKNLVRSRKGEKWFLDNPDNLI